MESDRFQSLPDGSDPAARFEGDGLAAVEDRAEVTEREEGIGGNRTVGLKDFCALFERDRLTSCSSLSKGVSGVEECSIMTRRACK